MFLSFSLSLSLSLSQDGTPTSRTFEHVPSEIGAEEAEEVGVEHLLRYINSLLTTRGKRFYNCQSKRNPVCFISLRHYHVILSSV